MIEVLDLVKNYGNDKAAVDGVSFTLQKGEILGLLGPNGAGKTTIMKILTGYHYPSSGTVTVEGLSIFEDDCRIKEKLGYLPENAPCYPELTVQEYLDFMAEARIGKSNKTASGLNKAEAIEQALEACSLKEVYYKGIDTLSKGYRQRVGLAQAILHDPEFLILDEPTSGLDPNQILEIRHLISNLGKSRTVMLSSHILPEVEAVCDRVIILNKGKIVAQGRTSQIGQELRGSCVCRVKLKEKSQSYLKLLEQKINGIKITEIKEREGNVDQRLELVAPAAFEARAFQEAVFLAAKESNAILLELSPVQASLEDVFISLTQAREEDHV